MSSQSRPRRGNAESLLAPSPSGRRRDRPGIAGVVGDMTEAPTILPAASSLAIRKGNINNSSVLAVADRFKMLKALEFISRNCSCQNTAAYDLRVHIEKIRMGSSSRCRELRHASFWGHPQSDSHYHHGRVNDRQTTTIRPGARFPSITAV
jgi:hypothetical protein